MHKMRFMSIHNFYGNQFLFGQLYALLCIYSISAQTPHKHTDHQIIIIISNNNHIENDNNNRLQYNYCTQSKWLYVVCDCNGPENIVLLLKNWMYRWCKWQCCVIFFFSFHSFELTLN